MIFWLQNLLLDESSVSGAVPNPFLGLAWLMWLCVPWLLIPWIVMSRYRPVLGITVMVMLVLISWVPMVLLWSWQYWLTGSFESIICCDSTWNIPWQWRIAPDSGFWALIWSGVWCCLLPAYGRSDLYNQNSSWHYVKHLSSLSFQYIGLSWVFLSSNNQTYPLGLVIWLFGLGYFLWPLSRYDWLFLSIFGFLIGLLPLQTNSLGWWPVWGGWLEIIGALPLWLKSIFQWMNWLLWMILGSFLGWLVNHWLQFRFQQTKSHKDLTFIIGRWFALCSSVFVFYWHVSHPSLGQGVVIPDHVPAFIHDALVYGLALFAMMLVSSVLYESQQFHKQLRMMRRSDGSVMPSWRGVALGDPYALLVGCFILEMIWNLALWWFSGLLEAVILIQINVVYWALLGALFCLTYRDVKTTSLLDNGAMPHIFAIHPVIAFIRMMALAMMIGWLPWFGMLLPMRQLIAAYQSDLTPLPFLWAVIFCGKVIVCFPALFDSCRMMMTRHGDEGPDQATIIGRYGLMILMITILFMIASYSGLWQEWLIAQWRIFHL